MNAPQDASRMIQVIHYALIPRGWVEYFRAHLPYLLQTVDACSAGTGSYTSCAHACHMHGAWTSFKVASHYLKDRLAHWKRTSLVQVRVKPDRCGAQRRVCPHGNSQGRHVQDLDFEVDLHR